MPQQLALVSTAPAGVCHKQRAEVRRQARRGKATDRDDSDSEEEVEVILDGESMQEVWDADEEFMDVEEDDNSMRLYLDSADVKEWERWTEAGLFYGFTTNPTILRRDSVQCNISSMRQLTREAFALDAEELQLQAWGTTAEELFACGLDLMDVDSRIVVKLPMTLAGAKAARKLINDGVPVTLTGVYAGHQVVSALTMGAAYAAPYLGRMTDAGKNGIEEVTKMQAIVDMGSQAEPMRLLVASIRSADEIATLAAEGCNTFTISPAVAAQLFDVRETIAAAATFQEHADEMGAMRGH